MNFLRWSAAFLVRALVWTIWAVRVPFAILGAACKAVNEGLEEIQTDIRNSCPWPWVERFEKRFEEARWEEQKRLMNAFEGKAK